MKLSETVCLIINIHYPNSSFVISLLAEGRGVLTAKAKLTKNAKIRCIQANWVILIGDLPKKKLDNIYRLIVTKIRLTWKRIIFLEVDGRLLLHLIAYMIDPNPPFFKNRDFYFSYTFSRWWIIISAFEDNVGESVSTPTFLPSFLSILINSILSSSEHLNKIRSYFPIFYKSYGWPLA